MFEEIFENTFGLGMGAATVLLLLVLRTWTLKPFLVHMSLPMAIFWEITTYVGGFAAGYIMGTRLFGE